MPPNSQFLKLDTLDPIFREKVQLLLTHLRVNYDIVMVPYVTRRTPHEQAAEWRQSRPTNVINKAINTLKSAGAPFLAKTLESVGPRSGPHTTNALPGKSWHQWDFAVDCYWEVNGKPNWSTTQMGKHGNGYRMYGKEAAKFELTSLGQNTGWDWVHVQEPKANAPNDSWAEIDRIMKAKYT